MSVWQAYNLLSIRGHAAFLWKSSSLTTRTRGIAFGVNLNVDVAATGPSDFDTEAGAAEAVAA